MAKQSDIVAKAMPTVGHTIRRVGVDGVFEQANRPNLDFAGNCTVQDTGDAIRVTVPDVPAGSVTVGNTITLEPGAMAYVRNLGTDIHATLEFGLPQGRAGQVNIGEVETLPDDAQAYVFDNGTPGNAVLNFGLPHGKDATIEVGQVTTLEPDEPATVTNVSEEAGAAIFDFGIPKGQGATVAVGEVETLMAGTPAYVTNVGSADKAVLNFGIPQGGFDGGAIVPVANGGTGVSTIEDARGVLQVPSLTTYATKDSAGLVQVGDGISVENGVISADIPDIDVATKDKAGIVQIGDGLSVTAAGVLSADAQKVDIATATTAGIVLPSGEISVDVNGVLKDEREVLYFDTMPAGGLPTTGVKEGAVAIINDGDDVVTLDAIADRTADILHGRYVGELPELTEEHVVGYLNGKPVYEKIIVNHVATTNAKTWNVIAPKPQDIDKVYYITGSCISANGINAYTIPYVATGANNMMLGIIGDNIVLYTLDASFSNITVCVTIRYTKTTD